MDLTGMLAERRQRHGDFTDQARIAQNLKRQVAVEPRYASLSAVHREAIEMILHKVARIVAGDPDFHDHWDDIAGYAKITRDRLPPPQGSGEPGPRREPRYEWPVGSWKPKTVGRPGDGGSGMAEPVYEFPDGTPLKDGARD